MNNNSAFDASIPVLTEVFQDQPVKDEVPAEAGALPEAVAVAEAEEPPQVADDAGEELEELAVGSLSEPQWAALERRLSERILAQLQDRVGLELDQRVRDSMEQALQHAIAGLTDEIRSGLQQTIEKIVVNAVGEELARLQTRKE
jgi:uncharacterized membrane-anchored protein YjiN (DUF445 family)